MVFIVLSGGLKQDGSMYDHVAARVHALQENINIGDVVIFSSIFSLNIEQKFLNGFVMSEARETMVYFQSLNPSFPASSIFLENASFDTIGSAYFVRSNFDWLIKGKDVCIITSDFHANRSQFVFKTVFELEPKLNFASLKLLSTINPPNIFKRSAKEKLSEANFKNLLKKFNSFECFKAWLFSDHDNYSNLFSSKAALKTQDSLYY